MMISFAPVACDITIDLSYRSYANLTRKDAGFSSIFNTVGGKYQNASCLSWVKDILSPYT